MKIPKQIIINNPNHLLIINNKFRITIKINHSHIIKIIYRNIRITTPLHNILTNNSKNNKIDIYKILINIKFILTNSQILISNNNNRIIKIII